MSLDPAVRQRIETLLGENRVVLFMKGQPLAPQCGFSAKAAGLLNDLGIAYAHVDVLSDGAIREGIKVYGQWPTIPQLYIDGELVGGSDIIEQMYASGELQAALGLPPPDRTPPQVTLTPAAVQMLDKAIRDAGGNVVVEFDIDAQYRTRLQLAAPAAHAIAVTVDGIALQFSLTSARRADGLQVDFADDERGRGLIINNPNAPKPVQQITPAQAAERIRAGTLTLVDVRPAEERSQAAVNLPFMTLDDGFDAVLALDKNQPVAFLCYRGGRSQKAADYALEQGMRNVYNITGGIDAWAQVDTSIPRY